MSVGRRRGGEPRPGGGGGGGGAGGGGGGGALAPAGSGHQLRVGGEEGAAIRCARVLRSLFWADSVASKWR